MNHISSGVKAERSLLAPVDKEDHLSQNFISKDSLFEILKYLTCADLAQLSRASKYSNSFVKDFISSNFDKEQRAHLVTCCFREMEKLQGWSDSVSVEVRVNLRYFRGLVLDEFKIGGLIDWQVDLLKIIDNGRLDFCFLSDFKSHTKLKLAILDGLDLENETTRRRFDLEYWVMPPAKDFIRSSKLLTYPVDKLDSFYLRDIYNYLIRKDDDLDPKEFKRLASLALKTDISLSDDEKNLLKFPISTKSIQMTLDSRVQIVIAAHLANDENYEIIWSFCSGAGKNVLFSALMDLIWKKNICPAFLLKLVKGCNFSMDDDLFPYYHEYLVLQLLRGSADKEIYLELLRCLNPRGTLGGFTTQNAAAACLEKAVILGECKDEAELREIVRHPEFKPSINLGLVCAMKGVSPEFIREMYLEFEDIDLPRIILYMLIVECSLWVKIELDNVDVEALKVLVEVLLKLNRSKEPDERHILNTKVITKDEVLLELVQHAYSITKKPVRIANFSCWSFPKTAHFILRKIELEDMQVSGIFDDPIGKTFKEWAMNNHSEPLYSYSNPITKYDTSNE